MAELLASDDNYNVDELIRESQAKIDLEIAQQFPYVSELNDIEKLHQEYAEEDDIYQQKVNDLKQRYVAFRKTRPDGNCFYRAFIFAYLESLFGDEPELKRFIDVCDTTRKSITELGFPDFTVEGFYEYFYEIVTSIKEGKITNSEELMKALDQPSMSDNIVVYLRLLTSFYLQKESEFFTNFIEGFKQMVDFCRSEVEPMYRESDHIHIIALCSCLDVNVRVVYMDRGAGGKVNEHDFQPIHNNNSQQQNNQEENTTNSNSNETNSTTQQDPRIHLLYRPGHYDILYKKKN